MVEPDGGPNTAHSTNPVPFVATVDGVRRARGRHPRRPGADGARTLLGYASPGGMTGVTLLVPAA